MPPNHFIFEGSLRLKIKLQKVVQKLPPTE